MSPSSHLTGVARDGLAWQLLQAMPEATFLVDRESLTILAANQRAEKLTGQSLDDLISRSLSEIFVAQAADDLSRAILNALALPAESVRLPVHLLSDGDQGQALIATCQALDGEGLSSGLVTVRPQSSTEPGDLRRQLAQGEERIRRLFDESPIAQFELDWSEIQSRLQAIRDSGVTDLRTWMDASPDDVAELGKQARITAVNRGALEMFEADNVAEFSGSLASILKQDSMRVFKEHLLFRANGGETFESENVAYTISGKRIYVHVRATPGLEADDSWGRIYASVSDITQRRTAEILRDGQRRVLESLAAINSVESVLRVLAEELERQSPNLRAAVFRTSSSDGKLHRTADGSAAEEIITLLDSVRTGSLYGAATSGHADIRLTATSRNNHNSERERIPPSVTELISRAIGACGYRCGVLKPATSSSGQLLGILAVFQRESGDFTDHEEEAIAGFSNLAELVLQHEEHRRALIVRTDELQSIFENYPDALLRISSNGTILESYSGNELTEFLRLVEAPAEQILWHLVPPTVSSQIRAAIANVAAGNRQEIIHFAVERDEIHRDFEIRLLPLPSTEEQIAVLRDVTQLKRAELKLEYASEQFRYLFEHSPDAIFVESPDGKVLDANQAACDLHKLSRHQLIGHDVLALIPADDRAAAASRSESLVSGKISEFESHSLQSDGQVVPVGVRISTITYNGNPAVLLHVRDITHQKKEQARTQEHERQLAHVSRLTMMGQLVAGIAHEIRQPLWSLSTFADVCVESLHRPDCEARLPQIRDVAGKIVSEARRVNAITTRMFSFARKGTAERTSCNIGEIANDAVELTAGRARSSRIKTTVHLDDELPAILCDRVLIEQTFANLLNNAYAAMSAHPSDSREVHIEILLDAEDRDYITASVRDNGPGLPDGVLPEQLFEGFFTTGQTGLGIGLALSRSFVEDHGGAIRAEVSPEGGMEFVFTLRIDGGNQPDAD